MANMGFDNVSGQYGHWNVEDPVFTTLRHMCSVHICHIRLFDKSNTNTNADSTLQRLSWCHFESPQDQLENG